MGASREDGHNKYRSCASKTSFFKIIYAGKHAFSVNTFLFYPSKLFISLSKPETIHFSNLALSTICINTPHKTITENQNLEFPH